MEYVPKGTLFFSAISNSLSTDMDETAPKIYIAIIEDDKSLCRSLARLLQASGYQPITYSSAEAFLYDVKHPGFDCLIVDIQLDGMSGIELSERLVASHSITPLIFITAHEDLEALKQIIHVPYAGLLGKNEPGEAVLAVIDRAIQIRNSQHQKEVIREKEREK